jgi:hypothetical protein
MAEDNEKLYEAQFIRTDRIYLTVLAKCGLEARERAQRKFDRMYKRTEYPDSLKGFTLTKVYPSCASEDTEQ